MRTPVEVGPGECSQPVRTALDDRSPCSFTTVVKTAQGAFRAVTGYQTVGGSNDRVGLIAAAWPTGDLTPSGGE